MFPLEPLTESELEHNACVPPRNITCETWNTLPVFPLDTWADISNTKITDYVQQVIQEMNFKDTEFYNKLV